MPIFTVAGVSRNKGIIKVRFCSDAILRIKNLQKQGDTDIFLIDLPCPMTKKEICNYLLAHPSFSKYNIEITESLDKRAPKLKVQEPVIKSSKKVLDPEVEELRVLAEA